jgi:hypothetical protein
VQNVTRSRVLVFDSMCRSVSHGWISSEIEIACRSLARWNTINAVPEIEVFGSFGYP